VSEIGLWNIARERPALTAVVDPNGREVGYGELATAADRYGRGLQQLGLRLEATRGPVQMLVIDNVERPSKN